MSRDIANECNQLLKAKNAELTTLRQQLAAAARECEAARRSWHADNSYDSDVASLEYVKARAATDAMIPDLAAAAKGGQ